MTIFGPLITSVGLDGGSAGPSGGSGNSGGSGDKLFRINKSMKVLLEDLEKNRKITAEHKDENKAQ